MNLSRSPHSFTSFSSKENKIHWGPDRKSGKGQLKYDQSMTVPKSRSIPQENYFSGTSSDLQEEKVGELRASDYPDFLKQSDKKVRTPCSFTHTPKPWSHQEGEGTCMVQILVVVSRFCFSSFNMVDLVLGFMSEEPVDFLVPIQNRNICCTLKLRVVAIP